MSEIDALLGRDLNLLVSLHVLLEERSVTTAARRVGVSQSAMSHQLKRLRESFDDPLFVTSAHGLLPTPRLIALEGSLRAALADLEVLLRPGEGFDPARSERRFTIAGSDILELVALPRAMAVLAAEAPRVQLASLPRTPDVADRLRRGEVDLAIAPGGGAVPGVDLARPDLKQRKLAEEGFRVLAREGHPVVKRRLSRKRYLSLGHVLVSPTGGARGVVDAVLAREGLRRTVRAQVSHFVAAPFLIARSDLLLTCPTSLAEAACELAPLRHFAPPFPLPKTPIHAYWHGRFQEDAAHRWLRDFVARTME